MDDLLEQSIAEESYTVASSWQPLQISPGESAETSDDRHYDDVVYLPSSTYVQVIVQSSLSSYFLSFLPVSDTRLKAVFWHFEEAVLRICTVIDTDDFDFERLVYEAELNFIAKFPNVRADFCIVFQEGRSLAEVSPRDSAHQVFP